MDQLRRQPVSKAQRRSPMVTLLLAAAACAWLYAMFLGVHAMM